MSYAYTPTDTQIEGILNAMAPDENGELPEDYFFLEEMLGNMLTQQYDGYTDVCRYYADMDAQAAAIKSEIDRLKAKRERIVKRQERLMDFLKDRLGDKTQQFGAFTYSSRRTPETLRFSPEADEEKIVNVLRDASGWEYIRKHPETYDLDKNAVKEGIKNGDLKFLAEKYGVTLEAGRKYKIS